MLSKAQIAAIRPYLIAFGIALVLFLANIFHIIDFHELDGIDLRFKIRGEQQAHPDIVVVQVDDTSISAIGQWPWPRSVYAVLIDLLSRYGAKSIFFDILFTEESPDPLQDQKLIESVERYKKVIMPFFFYEEKPFGAFFPIEGLRKAAFGTGFVNAENDRDGVIRKVRARIKDDEGKAYYHPAFSQVILEMRDEKKGEEWFKKIPVVGRDDMWLNYPGHLTAFKSISFWKIIDAAGGSGDEEMTELFKDRFVIVGHTGTGTTDLVATPFGSNEVGVTVQASALHTLLTKKFVHVVPPFVDLIICLLIAGLAVWITQNFKPNQALGIVAGVVIGYALLNFALFYFLRWIFPLFSPITIAIVSYGAALFIRYIEVRFKDELINRELKTAARIQSNFLPDSQPKFKGVDISFKWIFAKQVGGDLFDWVELGDDKLGVCVGDVSGKGVPASLYMAKVISEFRRENKLSLSPGKVNEALNNALARSDSSGMFVTLYYGVIDLKKKTLCFSSGGHDPMVYYSAKEKKAVEHPEAQGTPLGLFEGSEFESSAEIPFEKGDVFVVVTDGIKELRNHKKEEFGIARLTELVQRLAGEGKSSKDLIEEAMKEMHIYQNGALPHDDRTILCVRFTE